MFRSHHHHLLLSLALAASLMARVASAGDLKDLYFGEAIFEAAQGRYFEALERLDAELAQHRRVDEPQRDTLHCHLATAEFDVGDFELDYRMHHRAGRAIKAVLEANVDDVIRNEAAFRLARIHFQKDQPEEALQALERIHGRIPDAIRDDLEFLRANVYLSLGRPADAVSVLTKLQGAPNLKGFAAYNLGIAYLQAGRSPEALQQLDQAGQIASRDPATDAIRDKSNMVLGRMMLETARFDRAQQSFDRVRLDGPYSNQALLSAGWADASAGNYERALVPWRLLVDRDTTDSAVQEARLALPFAYGKLNVHGRAAVLYGQALDSFGVELEKVDASIRSIREGNFLKALVREEIHQDQNWVVRLRTLPDAPETFYLTTLMASHDFQTALHNYLDLEDLHHKLLTWQRSFDAYDDLIRLRRANYEPLLPQIDGQFHELDSQMKLRVEQRDHLRKRLHDILTAPRPELLATADERIALERIRKIEKAIEGIPEEQRSPLQAQARRLRGALVWTLRTEYPQRLTQAHKDLKELQQSIDVLTAQYAAFVRTRQAAVHSYVGYDEPIMRLRTRVGAALSQVELLMAQQGTLIETVAMNELKARGARLEAYQNQARYAVADSYDRATKAQAQAAGELR
jgi:tetratricopeptide (TPR) repeat protein